MAANTNSLSLRSVLEKEKLNGLNFLDWFRNLRIVLKQERKLYVIEKSLLDEPPANASRANKDAYKKHLDDMVDVGCLMLATMNPELQKQHEDMVAYDMIEHLKELYQGQARQERFDISKALFQCKLAEGSPIGPHVLKMIGYIEKMSKLGFPLGQELATDVILQSLSDSYSHGTTLSILRKSRRPKQAERLLQGLQRSRTLARGDVDLRVGNGARVAALAMGTYTLSLPSGLDVCGPINTQGRGGFHYFITFTDDFSRYGYVYLMRHKFEALEKFKEFKNEVQNQLGKTIKTLRSDQGGEYLSLEFDDLLKECGIVSQLTPPGTPQWNGVSKRRKRTLLDMVRSMMSHADLPTSFWGHALETAIFTLNRVPSKSVQKMPYEMWTGKRPKIQPPRRSLREFHAPERYGFLITTHGDILLIDQDEPRTYQEAVASPNSEKWLEAMRSEMDSMYENQVWTLVDPPEGVKPIGCKWVFKKKTDMDGNVQTYKGRLVAKGFRQIHGVDYDETFSLVAMFKPIRILLAIAAFHNYEIWQMDVKTAFLNWKLEEDVYITQPEGFVNPKDAGKIYEPCVYKKVSGSIITFLVLYVDDILIMGNNIPTLQSIKTWLGSRFSMKDLGEATYILGVKIYRDRSKRLLGLSQGTYIDKVLKRFNMEESKRGLLPMRHGISLPKEMYPSTPQERERMSKIPYASTIGSIMYAMLCTRPDVSYALSMTSKYQVDPVKGHWTTVKNIHKYLRRTKDTFLIYGGEEELSVKGYTDASFQTDKDDSRSQSGFVFCLNGGAVSWKSSKQSTVANSTTEAEYIAASEAAKEAVWIKKFITELGVVPSISDAIELRCDNNGAIAQAKEPRSHQRSKHILRRYHLI
ncbi:hypothetical protein CXB51_022006 [Gossypium anomalum]|uniref:Integrase catalytic domain-containing protein n=1 Tax=Gossypium anomalum TaxID=47600 RepID=A0A8J5Z761_9ROSI|nr:hypothetical protein CXB51_022006 [Gossypium anomalum]